MNNLTLRGSGVDSDDGLYSMYSSKEWIVSLNLKRIAGPWWQPSNTEHSITISSAKDTRSFYIIWIRGRVVENHIANNGSITIQTVHPVPLNSDVTDTNGGCPQ